MELHMHITILPEAIVNVAQEDLTLCTAGEILWSVSSLQGGWDSACADEAQYQITPNAENFHISKQKLKPLHLNRIRLTQKIRDSKLC